MTPRLLTQLRAGTRSLAIAAAMLALIGLTAACGGSEEPPRSGEQSPRDRAQPTEAPGEAAHPANTRAPRATTARQAIRVPRATRAAAATAASQATRAPRATRAAAATSGARTASGPSSTPRWQANTARRRYPTPTPVPRLQREYEGINPFVNAYNDPQSTFSLDGDTASFQIGRAWIEQNGRPEPDSVRTEEWVNAAPQGYPRQNGRLSLHLDGSHTVFPQRYLDNEPEYHRTLRVGVSPPGGRGRATPVSVIFLIDTSGSMANNLPGSRDSLLDAAKDVVNAVIDNMQPGDEATAVAYGTQSEVIEDWRSYNNRDRVASALTGISPNSSTNVQAGLWKAYDQADKRVGEYDIRIILISDGVANQGITAGDAIMETVGECARKNATVHSIGVGSFTNYNDVMLETLANRGNGSYQYLHDDRALAAFWESGARDILAATARDARIQVEFNPDVVESYRLFGYENRAVADSDFQDDTLDFGEPAASKEVTAIYELRMRYDGDPETWAALVTLRYQPQGEERHTEISEEITVGDLDRPAQEASAYLIRAAAVALFSEHARQSPFAACTEMANVRAALEDSANNRDGFDTVIQNMAWDANNLTDVPCKN